MPGAPLPSLSVVIPVLDEPDWIGDTVTRAATALAAAPFADPEIVVVDDGSGPATRAVLDALRPAVPLRVIRQENQGRFAARRRGIQEARGELALLLDARVSLDPDALRFVGEAWSPERAVWNGHCEIDRRGNPYARFWETLTRAAFPAYLANPRTVSFGLEDYDRFPKGTGHFLAPRAWLLDAVEGFSTHFADSRFASDDTHLLRAVAARQPITISPGFASVYHSRTSLTGFLRHAFHRGTTFFDGFARRRSRFLPVLVATFPASLLAAAVAVRRPRLALAGAASSPVLAAVAARRWGRPWADALAFAALTPPFAVAYVAGIWRGALLAALARLRS